MKVLMGVLYHGVYENTPINYAELWRFAKRITLFLSIFKQSHVCHNRGISGFKNMEITMFIGRHSIQFDTTSKFRLPSQYREALMNGAFITQGFDHNLLVLTASAFEALVEHIQRLNMADPLVRLLFRLVMARAVPVQPDDKGIIEVPAPLAELADLKDEIIIVGQGEYIEIWSTETWQKQESSLNDTAANSYRFKDLNISGCR